MSAKKRAGLGAAAKAAKKRQTYPKPPADSEAPPTSATPASVGEQAPKPAKRQTPHRRKSAVNGTTSPARERAKQLAQERYGVTSKATKTRAERMAERRQSWVQLNVEITPEHAAKMEALSELHGGKKAAIAHLIETAKL